MTDRMLLGQIPRRGSMAKPRVASEASAPWVVDDGVRVPRRGSIDGHHIPDFDRLTVRIAQHQPGDKVELEIIRKDKRMKITPVLGAWPDRD